MGRIDPKLIVQGEESSIKVVKFKGKTSIVEGHQHDFVVYEDDTIEIFEVETTNGATGNNPKLSATGDDSNIDIAIKPKGTGETVVGTGAANATITSSGAHDLILDTKKLQNGFFFQSLS